MNGHTPNDSSITNGTGTAASPPKSPATAPVTDLPAPSGTAHNETPATNNEELKQESKVTEGTDTSAQPQVSESTTSVAATESGVNASSTPQPASESAPATDAASDSLDGASGIPNQMAIDSSLATAPAELPHHPTYFNTLPSLRSIDHEMEDAPTPPPLPHSPSKVSRERDADPMEEEPAPKRTKVETEVASRVAAPVDFKPTTLPTPSTETAGPLPAGGQNGLTKMQHKFISKSLSSLKRMHDSRFYREPVDPIKLNIPNYTSVITRPMDLGTMERKLKNNEYSSPKAVAADFALMVQNSLTFNGPDHLVAQEGQKLLATFEKQMQNIPKPEEVEEKKPKKTTEKTSAARREPRTSLGSSQPAAKATSPQSTTFALGPEGLPVIRRDSTNPDGRPKRSIHPPKRDLPYSTKPKKKKYQWELRFCQEVLEELHKPKHQLIAWAFYQPVDPVALNIPTYHSVIKKPMDLSTIQSKLKTGQYENAKEFESDIRLMFKNCYRFNIQGDPTYAAGLSLEAVFNEKWGQMAEYLDKHEPQHDQQSDDYDEDSDDESEEEDEDTEKLTLLQRQIAEMSRQVEMITNKKKKTPPSSKKAGTKAKSIKKDGKKISSSKKEKKPKTSFKPEKARFVTYHEKQVISNGISSLPDKKMQEALKIIQSNVPELKGTQEAEIELDIDELPNDVLLMLLKFVKKNVPHLVDDEDPAPAANVAPSKPKKNKPMSKNEQEAQIAMLEGNLSRFAGGGSPVPVPSVEGNESSEDESDDDSEESEEE
jgi:bromodomain-containing factor 1